MIDAGLNHLTEFLRKRSRKALYRALVKIKTGSNSSAILSNEIMDDNYCESKGMVSLVSREGVMHLNVFISFLAVFHVLYCILTMCLGVAKMSKWKAWEEETRTLHHQIANDARRFRLTHQTSFGRRHLKFWSNHPLLLWLACFARQFSGSVSKTDYLTLRNGFIMANVAAGSDFNFHKLLTRTFDDDFEQVVGIRFYIWIFPILFIFFSANEFYNYYWLPFIPLVIVLVVGTKLEVTITKMCMESCKENPVTRGTFLVKPSDDYFWFGRPNWLLHLLQLNLIQNSFQLAFFIWTWYEYGLRSCFNEKTEDFTIRITMGMAVQLICGYVTLPLYALVTQMGSSMKTAVFTERIVRGLKNWQKNARRSLSKNRSTSSIHSLNSLPPDTADTSITGIQRKNLPDYEHRPPLAVMSPSSSAPEITEQEVHSSNTPNPAITILTTTEITKEEANPVIITRGTYDGEISFGSSWKELEISRDTGEITSITEEDASGILSVFNHQHIDNDI
nr:MLO-like protein 6 [Quercus suber]POE46307.1 mlo-like protein 6 [Quercus suber]